jgi:hypothetical protein
MPIHRAPIVSTVAVRGSVSGLEVASDGQFQTLRDGGGSRVEVIEGDLGEPVDAPALIRWLPRPDNPFEATLYATDEGYRFWVPGVGGFGVEVDAARLVLPRGAEPLRREARAWGVPAALLACAAGDQPLHAAAVEVAGRALLLCGPSHFGKTTLAAAFLAAGHRLLSEDLTRCRPTTEPTVFPGPALLRLRRDVSDRVGPIPSTTVAAEDVDRVFVVLDGELRGSGSEVPLAGIVVLRRGAGNLELTRVEPERFLPELFTMAFGLPTDEGRAASFGAVAVLARAAPMWVLDRPLRFDLLPTVVDALISRCVV